MSSMRKYYAFDRFLDLPPEIRRLVYESILVPGPVTIQMMSAEVPLSPAKLDWRKDGRQAMVDEDLGPRRTAIIEKPGNIWTTNEAKRARWSLRHMFNLMQSCRLVYDELAPIFYAAFRPSADYRAARLFVKTFQPNACPLKQISLRSTQSISQRSLAAFVHNMPELESLSIELWTIRTSKIGGKDDAVLARWELRRLHRLLCASQTLAKVFIVPNTKGYRGGHSFKYARLVSANSKKEGAVSS